MTDLINGVKVVFVRDDITRQDTEAIVNAANSGLLGGGGVDGAIHRAGGPEILAACQKIRDSQGRLPTGEAVITTGGNLAARYVIHTVGPVWHGGGYDESGLLRNAYRNSLELANARGIKSISFPSISTGAYLFPTEQAAAIAVAAVRDFAASYNIPTEIRFVLFSERDLRIYRNAWSA